MTAVIAPILSVCLAFVIAGVVLKVFTETGEMVLIEHLKEDWTYRLPFRLRNNRYRGLSRPSYQLLAILYYIFKAVVILTLCAYYYMLVGVIIAGKWIRRKGVRLREAKIVDSESEDDILQTDRLYAMTDNIGDMTVDQKMVVAVQEFIGIHGVGYVATKSELHDFIHDRYKIASGSIIPSDYCYNRINNGISLTKPTLFEHLDRGQYRCLGEGYPYNGSIWHKEQIIGSCVNGVRERIYGISDNDEAINTTKTQKGRNPSTRLRFEVLARDKFTCRFCGASPTKDPSVTLHIDHIVPWSKGGETSFDNLQTLCSKCNLGKSDLMIAFPDE